MLGVTPKSFDAINMVFDSAPAHETFGMDDRMMFPIGSQGLNAPNGIPVIDRAFPLLGLDMPHEFFGTDRLHDFGIHAVFLLQQPKHDIFASGASAPFPLPLSHKVGLIQFDLPFEFAPFQLGQMVLDFSHSMVDPCHHFDVHSQISTQPTQAFALVAELEFHIAPTGVQDFERSTKNALPATQKVGRTTKNRVSSSKHESFLAHIGYETPQFAKTIQCVLSKANDEVLADLTQ
ncbi:MAG: hypothetical protein ABI618_02520 [Nitrospirota bacterium]